MGIVSLRILSRIPTHCDCLMELMPRSDRARLIDFVKFNGVVDGSRKSKLNHIRPLYKGKNHTACLRNIFQQ